MQNALKEEKVEVEKGGVKITMDGNQEIISCSVDSGLLTGEKKSQLENAVKDAMNAAIEKTKKVVAQKMQKMGGFEQFGLGK